MSFKRLLAKYPHCDVCEEPARQWVRDTFQMGIELGQDGCIYERSEGGPIHAFCKEHGRESVHYSLEEPDVFWLEWHRQGMTDLLGAK